MEQSGGTATAAAAKPHAAHRYRQALVYINLLAEAIFHSRGVLNQFNDVFYLILPKQVLLFLFSPPSFVVVVVVVVILLLLLCCCFC